MGLGFAWDCAVAYLMDFGSEAAAEATGGGPGPGQQAGLGVLFDYDGDDVYLGSGQGLATPQISYHSMPSCGGNFSFVIDYGGTDQYGCQAKIAATTSAATTVSVDRQDGSSRDGRSDKQASDARRLNPTARLQRHLITRRNRMSRCAVLFTTALLVWLPLGAPASNRGRGGTGGGLKGVADPAAAAAAEIGVENPSSRQTPSAARRTPQEPDQSAVQPNAARRRNVSIHDNCSTAWHGSTPGR